MICFLNCSVDEACGTEVQLLDPDLVLFGLVEVELKQFDVVEEFADRFELSGFSFDIGYGALLEMNRIDQLIRILVPSDKCYRPQSPS
jgi:hypothetical protein